MSHRRARSSAPSVLVAAIRSRCGRAALSGAVALLLGACAVGPDFQRPAPPEHGGFAESALPLQLAPTGAPAQQLRVGNDLAAQWWTLYHSEPLNRFIADALRDNATLAAADAALRQASETLAVNEGNLLLPGVNGQLGLQRERASGAAIGFASPANSFTLFNAGVNVSYTLDVFGGIRRQLEGLRAQIDYQQNQLRAAQLALTANIVTAVIREAQLRDQVQALREVEKIERSGLAIVERRFALGAVTKTDVLNQRSALAATVAQIPPLERQRAQMRHLLALYAGKTPAEVDLAALDLAHLELPADLPVSLPSELARQRPDILEAEALLHQASAQVGVATASLYPQITLAGNYGYTALSASQLFKPATAVWGLGANLIQPIFHGAALSAARRAALAAFDQAAANYRQTVLTAFANVADALRALEFDAQALAAVADSYDQARAAAELAQRQFDSGAASYLSLLSAQQQYQQAAVQLVQARADRFADTAALFQSLGGGWWNAAPDKPVASN